MMKVPRERFAAIRIPNQMFGGQPPLAVSGGTACFLRGIRPLDCPGWPHTYALNEDELPSCLAPEPFGEG
jgi:hypothetical protein